MAQLTLTKIFVNLMATAVSVSAQSAPARTQEYAAAGDVRTYGGGRQRAVQTQGEAGIYNFQLRQVSAADLLTLRTWMGQTVEVRNHKGERYVGTYFDLKVAEWFADPYYDVDIILKAVTYPDGV